MVNLFMLQKQARFRLNRLLNAGFRGREIYMKLAVTIIKLEQEYLE